MKKFIVILSLFFIFTGAVFADEVQGVVQDEIQDAVLSTTSVEIFQDKNCFGLKSETGEILVMPVFRKLIKIGDLAWIAQKNSRFGLIDKSGSYLVEPKYRFADRMFGKYAKLGNGKDYGLYDETGYAVIAPEYSVIEPLRGGMFLINKNYKYGVLNSKGEELLPNIFDSIYMQDRNTMRVKYEGQWYELNEPSHTELSDDITKLICGNKEFTITKIITSPAAASGYSAVTATNYFLKVFSALSPSYEQTIDELVYSQGADAVGILMNFSWLPKFPYTYAKNYYNNIKAPNTGPLNNIRGELKNRIK